AKLSLFRPQCYQVKDNGGNVSGRANIAYQVTDDVMTYASYARGYKAGGLNMSGLQLTGGTGAGRLRATEGPYQILNATLDD
ncbi:MAG: TonB-dependent receptor, partial [Bdellovibrionia bacterium]